MKITIGPTGALVQGDVLDVNQAALEERLRDYDSQLYLKWNPRKRGGYGIYELWRRPEKKKQVPVVSYNGMAIYSIEYVETTIENCVFEVPTLNYRLLEKLKKNDTWAQMGYERGSQHKLDSFVRNLDYDDEAKHQADEERILADLMYNMKQEKSALRDYKEAILSGTNPADIMKGWK